MDDLPVAGERDGLDDLVVPVERDALFLVVQRLEQRQQVLGVEQRGALGDAAGVVGVADDPHPVVGDDHPAQLGALDVAALLHRQIDQHRARLHRGDMLARHQHRRLAPGDQRRGDDDVLLLDVLGDQRRLLALVVVGHLLGVAARRLGLFELLVLHRDEAAAQALHLLLDRRTHVGRRDDGAQPLGGGDGLQTGDADAHDEGAGRRHRARRGHHHREGPAVLAGRVDHRLVAGEVGLRGQHVHHLGAGDARHELHGQGGDPGRGVGGQRLPRVVGLEDAEQQGAAPDQRQFVAVPFPGEQRALHLQHDVGVGQRRRGVRRDGGAGLGVQPVRQVRPQTGAGLHDHFQAEGFEFLDRLRRRRDAILARAPLPGYGDFHDS